MARCPGSEKVRATVASAIQGSSSGGCHDGLVTPEHSVSGQDAGGYRGRSQTWWSCRVAEGARMGNWIGDVGAWRMQATGCTVWNMAALYQQYLTQQQSLSATDRTALLYYTWYTRDCGLCPQRVPCRGSGPQARVLRSAAERRLRLGLSRAGSCAELAMQWCSASSRSCGMNGRLARYDSHMMMTPDMALSARTPKLACSR